MSMEISQKGITMDHSEAFNSFYAYRNATGMEKAYGGYNLNLLSEIFPWERDEIEEVIFHNASHGIDTNLAVFLPQLQNHNGISALKSLLENQKLPVYAFPLYEATNDETYLDVIREIIHESGLTNPNAVPPVKRQFLSQAVSMLNWVKPSVKSFDIFAEVYIETEDEILRSSAIDGLMKNIGIIVDPMDHELYKEPEVLEQVKTLFAAGREDRIKHVERLRPKAEEWIKDYPRNMKRVVVSTFDGKRKVNCISVKQVLRWNRETNTSAYVLVAVDGVSYMFGIHSVNLGWYADKDSIAKEMSEIREAMKNSQHMYELKYYINDDIELLEKMYGKLNPGF